MNANYRRRLVALITFFAGLYFFLEFLLPEQIGSFKFGAYHVQILQGVTVFGAMAFGLGLINIVRIHGTRLVYVQRGWVNSLSLIAGMILMFILQWGEFMAAEKSTDSWKSLSELPQFVSVVETRSKALPGQAVEQTLLIAKTLNAKGDELAFGLDTSASEKADRAKTAFQLQLNIAKENTEKLRGLYVQKAASGDVALDEAIHAQSVSLNDSLRQLTPPAQTLAEFRFESLRIRKASSMVYNGIFVPLGAAMFSLLGFYIATAAYRSFRLKSFEAAAMMTTAIVVILGQISYGPLYISENLPAIRLWLLQNLNTPGNRAIYFGAVAGGFAMAFRMWFSLEPNPLETDRGDGA